MAYTDMREQLQRELQGNRDSAPVVEAAESWDGEIPGRDRVRIIMAGAPPPSKTVSKANFWGWLLISTPVRRRRWSRPA